LAGPEYIYIGEDAGISSFCWLGVYPQKGLKTPRLSIGDGTEIGNFSHITCVNRVEIGSKVLIADRVHISDNEHVFSDVAIPIVDQGVTSRGPVVIGDGSWIGENVNVLSCKIGKHCVIGANSVVISDIPDFSVAVGLPARVVKQYNRNTGRWERI
jgi:acetyltransferase-like isoleucine patch superfamily enzyme